MARIKGIAGFSANFEPQIAAALDARTVVEFKADLILTETWEANDGLPYPYKGMPVAVVDDTPENSGLYLLIDFPVTEQSSWLKIGTNGEAVDTSKWELEGIEGEKTGYGALYNKLAVSDAPENDGFIEGFYVPDLSQNQALWDLFGGMSEAGTALKTDRIAPEFDHPRLNENGVGNNLGNIALFCAGFRDEAGAFAGLGEFGWIWFSGATGDTFYLFTHDSNDIILLPWAQPKSGKSVRVVRELTQPESELPDGEIIQVVQDYDGNLYEVVKLGNLGWLAQNLRTTHYANGEEIPIVPDTSEWANLTSAGVCFYNNNPEEPGIVYEDEMIGLSIIKPKNFPYRLQDALEIDPVDGDEKTFLTQKGTFKQGASSKGDENIINTSDGEGNFKETNLIIDGNNISDKTSPQHRAYIGDDGIFEIIFVAIGLSADEIALLTPNPLLLAGFTPSQPRHIVPKSHLDAELAKIEQSRWQPGTEIKSGYGAHYNWWVTQKELIEDFFVPTTVQWVQLFEYVGENPDAYNRLVSIRVMEGYGAHGIPSPEPHWEQYDLHAGVVDDLNFSIVPAGFRATGGSFLNIRVRADIWSSSEINTDNASAFYLSWEDYINPNVTAAKRNGQSVRLARALTPEEEALPSGTLLQPVQDFDGNWYSVVKLGDLAWTGQNLRTTHFADGTSIPIITNNTLWSEASDAAMAWPENNPEMDGIVYPDERVLSGERIEPKDLPYALRDAKEVDFENGDEKSVLTQKGTFRELLNPDFYELDPQSIAYIKNKPIIDNSKWFIEGFEPETIEFMGVEYKTVINPVTGKIWLDRNIGASRVALAPDDEQAYGHFFQWGRLADGHELRTSGTTEILSNSDVPGHGDFILADDSGETFYDWRDPQNDNLWQGLSGINLPAPAGFRVPTTAELIAEVATWSGNNILSGFNSVLKIPAAGIRTAFSGDISLPGGQFNLWHMEPYFNSAFVVRATGTTLETQFVRMRAGGSSLRLIKDEPLDGQLKVRTKPGTKYTLQDIAEGLKIEEIGGAQVTSDNVIELEINGEIYQINVKKVT